MHRHKHCNDATRALVAQMRFNLFPTAGSMRMVHGIAQRFAQVLELWSRRVWNTYIRAYIFHSGQQRFWHRAHINIL